MQEAVVTYLKKADPILVPWIDRVPFPDPVTPASDYFRELCDIITGQQLSTKVADTIFKRFVTLFPGGLITPAFMVTIAHEALRGMGLSNAKANYIHDLAEKVISGEVALNRFATLDDDTIKLELVKVKGIGPWTAEMFLIFSLGRDDIFSPGDLGLKNAMKKIYNNENITLSEMLTLSEKWKPYRSWASRILWRTLEIKD